LTLAESASEGQVTLGVDPSSPATKVVVALQKDGVVTVGIDVPQSVLSRLGLSPDALGLSGDPTVELHADAVRKPTGQIDGHVTFAMYAIRVASARPSASPLDVRLVAGLSGDSADAIALTEGLVGMGPAKGKLTGTLALTDRSARVELSMKWPGASGAPPLPSAFVIDTRSLAPPPSR
jgi:hypothetical protein